MRVMLPSVLVVSLFLVTAQAATIRIAAASDLRFAMPTIVAAFSEQHPEYSVNVVYGSSGRFYSQIRNGAPFHLYFSADIEYPQRLLATDIAAGSSIKDALAGTVINNRAVYPYAQGLLAAWMLADNAQAIRHPEESSSEQATVDLDTWLNAAVQQRRGRIAIANPEHAPYGVRALEWLQQHPRWAEIEGRLVYAENVAQVAHFVRSGSAQLGILALPLALSKELTEYGQFIAIPEHQHAPIMQGMLLTEYGYEHAGAQMFFAFLQSAQAKDILQAAGFLIPSERDMYEPQ
ncbi:molybdate ABC transporter substrate-binding protein [Aliidiomarina sp.]|uniref:molybdate ABC transporter substrate-binding protein n=1 Tax=Aliidiomarina sp. TaxID=1872439 RepID=UPI003A4E2F1C